MSQMEDKTSPSREGLSPESQERSKTELITAQEMESRERQTFFTPEKLKRAEGRRKKLLQEFFDIHEQSQQNLTPAEASAGSVSETAGGGQKKTPLAPDEKLFEDTLLKERALASWRKCLQLFFAKGGNIAFRNKVSFPKTVKTEEEKEKHLSELPIHQLRSSLNNSPLTLIDTDYIYPICIQGINRSQVLYRFLADLLTQAERRNNPVDADSTPSADGSANNSQEPKGKNEKEVGTGSTDGKTQQNKVEEAIGKTLDPRTPCGRRLQLPHGAANGNDPYFGFRVENENDHYGYIRDAPSRQDIFTEGFMRVFGENKVKRFGDDLVDLDEDPNSEDFSKASVVRCTLRNFFSQSYYGFEDVINRPMNVRHVYIAFNRSVHIVIYRLLESNPGKSLGHIFVVALDYADQTRYYRDFALAYEAMKKDFTSLFIYDSST